MEQLRTIPLLSGLSEQDAQEFGARCIWKECAEGELLVDHCDESSDVRFILSGTVRVIVRVSEGRKVILNDAGPGDFFGELSAIDGHSRSANVTAITRCRMCIMPSSVFMEILDQSPKINRVVLNKLTKLVRILSNRLSEYSFLRAKYRLYAELLRLSSPRQGHPDQRVITPPPIQREIAERIASRREVVSREMKSLQREGCLEKTRGALILTDIDELNRRIAKGWSE
jgi:CRP-like cAMP-binding protein